MLWFYIAKKVIIKSNLKYFGETIRECLGI